MAMLRAMRPRGSGGNLLEEAAGKGTVGPFGQDSGDQLADAAGKEAPGFDMGAGGPAPQGPGRRPAPPMFAPDSARSGEKARDRATPGRPMMPSPMAGSVSQGPMPGPGLQPFAPMGQGHRGLFGRNRGLQGGGLGVMSPNSGVENDPIEELIALLMRGQ